MEDRFYVGQRVKYFRYDGSVLDGTIEAIHPAPDRLKFTKLTLAVDETSTGRAYRGVVSAFSVRTEEEELADDA